MRIDGSLSPPAAIEAALDAPLPRARLGTEIPQGADTFRPTRLNVREYLLEARADYATVLRDDFGLALPR